MPAVELLAVGTELLLGQLVDTNTAFIAQAMAASGIDVYGAHAVGDNRSRIANAVRAALDRVDGVIATGGLGPTVDDLTKEAVADALGLELLLDNEALEAIGAMFAALGREMTQNNRKQAFFPAGSYVLQNPRGSAPGFVARRGDGKFVACMPGVPAEMKPMLADQLLPWLHANYALRSLIVTRIIHTIGMAESEIDRRIADLFATLENPKIAVLAHGFRCDVKIMAKASTQAEARTIMEPVERELLGRLGDVVFGFDEQTIEGEILALLRERGQTVSVAESCTGGLVASALARIPGASKAFFGGAVAYDNSLKERVLGVSRAALDAHGAVSEEVALAMAQGARSAFGTGYAVAVTGIAGPDGGTAEKPVGLVWFATAGPAGVRTHRVQFRADDRVLIQQRASLSALALLWQAVRAEPIKAG